MNGRESPFHLRCQHPGSAVACSDRSLDARPFGLAFGHGLCPLVRSAPGDCHASILAGMPTAHPVPDGGSLRSRPLLVPARFTPMLKWGGETSRIVSAVAATPRLRFIPPPPPVGERGELKGEKGIRGFRRWLPPVAYRPALRRRLAAGGTVRPAPVGDDITP